RVWADHFPAEALVEPAALFVAQRAGGLLQQRLDEAAGGGRRVEKQHTAGFAAGILPGVRHVARKEGAAAGSRDRDLLADLEGDLAGQHPGDFVAVLVEMKRAADAGRYGLLEHHDALAGFVTEQLEIGEAAGRSHVEILAAARGYDKAFACAHVGILSCDGARIGVGALSDNDEGLTDSINLEVARRGRTIA